MEVLDQNALETLRELQDEGEDDLLCELIDLFLADAPGRMAGIRAAIEHEDWTALAATAHSLKGSCGSLGAIQMAEVCARLEQHGRTAAPPAVARGLFEDLEVQFGLVRDALQRERDGRR